MYFQCGEGWGVTPAIVTSGFILGLNCGKKGEGGVPDPRPMKGFSGEYSAEMYTHHIIYPFFI